MRSLIFYGRSAGELPHTCARLQIVFPLCGLPPGSGLERLAESPTIYYEVAMINYVSLARPDKALTTCLRSASGSRLRNKLVRGLVLSQSSTDRRLTQPDELEPME
jgi:hypothetical protein